MFARFGGYLLGCLIAVVFAGVTFVIAFALGVQQSTSVVALIAAVFYFLCVGLSYAIAWVVQTNSSWINALSMIFFAVSYAVSVIAVIALIMTNWWLAVAIFLILFFCAAVYLTVALLPKGLLNLVGYVLAQTTSYDTNPAIEQFWRGFNAGTNGVYAGVLAATIYSIPFFILHPLLGAPVALLLVLWFLLWPLFALLNSTDDDVKSVIGRTSFFNPTSWFMCGLGAVLFLLSFSLHWIGWALGVPWLEINSIRIDRWGSIICIDGLGTNLSMAQQGGYDLGTFLWIFPNSANLATFRHEAGHALSLGLFGGHFQLIGFVDEMLQGLLGIGGIGTGLRAGYAERVAESNAPVSASPTFPRVFVWLDPPP